MFPDFRSLAGLLFATTLLAACGGGTAGLTTETIPALGKTAGEKPVALTKRTASRNTGLPPALMPLKQARAEHSLNRYLLNQGSKQATHKMTGADLDGDGRAEAIIYLEGEDWCVETGCTLLVMRDGPTGFDLVSLVKRVKLPVSIAPRASVGWRDIMVKTGQLGASKLVALKFDGSGYPGNANTQPATVADLTALPEIAIRPSRTALTTTPPGSNLIAGQN